MRLKQLSSQLSDLLPGYQSSEILDLALFVNGYVGSVEEACNWVECHRQESLGLAEFKQKLWPELIQRFVSSLDKERKTAAVWCHAGAQESQLGYIAKAFRDSSEYNC